MNEHIVHHAFMPPPKSVLRCTDATRTQQHFKDECDINNILAKYMRTGVLEQLTHGAYMDVSESVSYQEAMDIINNANETFAALPSNIRAEFQNNPSMYMDFLHNPDNSEKAEKLGLTNPKPKPPLQQIEPIPSKNELS